ncbi:MAG: YigZ family protein [Clostridia bacterium]|nr:YigZ family protein [Clostridia bacterium]
MNDDRLEGKKTYTTLQKEASAEFEEKHSLFIGHARPVKCEEEAMAFIKEKKKEFSDATHNVFGYLMKGGACARYSDDGEPQGTAGMPVLDTIRKSGVDDACVVVTRYFGGILLGAGGLVRAYANGAKLALEAAGIVVYEKYTVLKISASYADYQKIPPLLAKAGALIDGTEFGENVVTTVAVKEDAAAALSVSLKEISAGRIAAEILGSRFDCPK